MPKDWVRLSCRIPRSEDLTFLWEHHPRAEGLFWRLLAVTDDFGRMEYNPRLLRADLVPLSNKPHRVFEEAVAILIERGMVTLYEARGRQYLQVTNYDLYQEDQAWTRIKATCPPPPDWVPPSGLVAFLRSTNDPVKFRPERYGLESDGAGSYRTVSNGAESYPPHLTSPHQTQHKTPREETRARESDVPPDLPMVLQNHPGLRGALDTHCSSWPLPRRSEFLVGLVAILNDRDGAGKSKCRFTEPDLERLLREQPPDRADKPESWYRRMAGKANDRRSERGPKPPDQNFREGELG